MAVKQSTRRYSSLRLSRLARSLLKASTLCAISTVAPEGRAHINAAYFAWTATFDIVWYSEPQALHSRNLEKNDSAAVVVYDSSQTWGKPDRGVMLFGPAKRLHGKAAKEAQRSYASRFRQFDAEDFPYSPYRLQARRIKLFDERALGGGTFVTARCRGGRLTWERTEIYD